MADLGLAALLGRCTEVGECLEWPGPYGIGRSSVTPIVKCHLNGRSENLAVVRLVWEQTKGPIPEGRIVYRHCCNHRCIRPECLRLGKRGDAHRHRKKMGLTAHTPASLAALTRGARGRATTKNSMEKARAVRALVAEGLRDPEIAVRTGVHPEMVADIRRGTAWRETPAVASVFSWRPTTPCQKTAK